MQRLIRFFKKTDKISDDVSLLESEIADLEMEIHRTPILLEKLKEQSEKLAKLNKDDELYRAIIYWCKITADGNGIHLDAKFLKDFLKAEKEEKDKCRTKMLQYRKMIQKTQEEADGEQKAWSLCEVCAYQFEDTVEKVPRVLTCGHTICHSCVNRLANRSFYGFGKPDSVKCPFDRIATKVPEGKVENIPINLILLHK